MSTVTTQVEIDYPESDGKPMGETDVHIMWTNRLRDILQYRYREQRVYVSGNLLVYYEQGNNRKFVVPDLFVVKDCDPALRRTYKIWEEPSPPQVVFEVTSRSSKKEDTVTKPRIYNKIGVLEYFVYDPTSDYLTPSLRGYRRQQDRFDPIEPDSDGWLTSDHLNIQVGLDAGRLVLMDPQTGEALLTEAEGERAARLAEQTAREALERELQKLRKQLNEPRDG